VPASPVDQAQRRGEDADLSVEAPGARETASVPWPLLLRDRMAQRVEASDRYRWIVLATTLSGLLTVTFTITILAVSIPTISQDLGTSESTLTWLITGPLLVFGVVGPAVGKLGDRIGHRRVYLVGLAGAAVFAGLTAIAWSGAALITFRVLGATMGAATGPSSMAIINTTFPPERRAQAMGYWTLVMAGGPVMGVVVGGPVVEAFSWRWIFVAQVALTVVGLVIALAILPETERRHPAPFDVAGTVLLAGAVGLALFGLNQGPGAGWGSTIVIFCFVVSPLLFVAFVMVERRAVDPLIPLRYLRRRNVTLPLIVELLLNFAYMGGFILTPLLLQNVLGYGEARTGLLSVPRPLAFSLTGPIAGYLAVKVGERTNAVVGSALMLVSMVGLAQIGPESSDLAVMVPLALSGVALGAAMPSLSASIANAVDDRDLGVVGASQQMAGQLGVVAGIQIMQTVQQSRVGEVGLAESYSEAYLVGAAVALVALAFSAFVHSTPRPGPAGGASRAGGPDPPPAREPPDLSR
jgi:EmrB/QacA subfamily drug resistance transporter